MSYNKDINGVHVQNWGLKAPTGSLIGVDGGLIHFCRMEPIMLTL
jgi:hypothetical protein